MQTDISKPEQSHSTVELEKAGVTYFASPERLDSARIQAQLQLLASHPLLDTLLNTVGGLLAVLNEHRQILALNENLLAHFGIETADKLLGLRLGEALECPHAQEMPAGCGTSRFCKTCGAAIAQAVALHHQKPAERLCALESDRNGTRNDLVLRVRATPLTVGDQKLILIFIEDVTRQQQNALAERAFHHDLNNTLTCLLHASETLATDTRGELAGVATEVHRLATRVIREFDLQRQLVTTDLDNLHPTPETVQLSAFLDDLRSMVAHHPAAGAKRITLAQPRENFAFITDTALLLRVLGNMAINALEATHPGGEIRIRVETASDHLDFHIWNEAPIPPEVALRVFQRNFSTKGTLGRGLGTYSMKLIGEKLLGGRVSFESSALDGTTFRFLLPL